MDKQKMNFPIFCKKHLNIKTSHSMTHFYKSWSYSKLPNNVLVLLSRNSPLSNKILMKTSLQRPKDHSCKKNCLFVLRILNKLVPRQQQFWTRLNQYQRGRHKSRRLSPEEPKGVSSQKDTLLRQRWIKKHAIPTLKVNRKNTPHGLSIICINCITSESITTYNKSITHCYDILLLQVDHETWRNIFRSWLQTASNLPASSFCKLIKRKKLKQYGLRNDSVSLLFQRGDDSWPAITADLITGDWCWCIV